MFSLQIQIRNLVPKQVKIHNSQQQTITIRFGPLQSDVKLIGQQYYSGGKRLMIDMQQSQLQNLFSTYAFGLFIKNQLGKFWCILNLQQININEKYQCPELIFYNDDRQICYKFDLVLNLNSYNPKLPKQVKLSNSPPKETSKNAIRTFLNQTNKIHQQNHTNVNQFQENKQKTNTKKQKQIKKKQNKVNYGVANYKQQIPLNCMNQQQSGIYIPPVMQFINQITTHPTQIIQQNEPKITFHTAQQFLPKYPKINTQMPKLKTFTNYSQFKQQNQQKFKKIKPTRQFNRNDLKQMAIKEAQLQINKKQNQIMIPIPNPKTGTYQLIPLSNLSEAQIIQYAQRQKKAEQYQRYKEQQLLKLKRKQQKKKKKLQNFGKLQKTISNKLTNQNVGPNRKIPNRQNISQKNKQSSSSNSQSLQSSQVEKYQNDDGINNNQQQEQDEMNQQNYESDFESISNAGSQMRSRLSLQSSRSMSQQKKKNNYEDASESIDDYGYSQDFDSFSQSLLSKNKKAINSISEISQSYTSMSNRK